MFSIITSGSSSLKSKTFTDLDYIRNGLERNLEKVIHFNRMNQQHVSAFGPLLKLIYSFSTGIKTEGHRYYELTSERVVELATGVDITNSINSGSVFENSIYGEDTLTVFVTMDTGLPDIDGLGHLRNWKDAESIRLLSGPIDTLNMDLPTGKPIIDGSGIFVVGVDIPLLAMQYREWATENITRPIGEQQSIQQFLTFYPLNNILQSQLNVALFNRYKLVSNKVPVSHGIRRTVTPLVNFDEKLNKELLEVVDHLERSELTVEELIRDFPLRANVVLEDILPNLQIVNTRAISWAVLTAWMPYLEFIVSHIYLNGDVNREMGPKLKRAFKQIRSSKLTQTAPDNYLRDYLDTSLEALLLLL